MTKPDLDSVNLPQGEPGRYAMIALVYCADAASVLRAELEPAQMDLDNAALVVDNLVLGELGRDDV